MLRVYFSNVAGVIDEAEGDEAAVATAVRGWAEMLAPGDTIRVVELNADGDEIEGDQ